LLTEPFSFLCWDTKPVHHSRRTALNDHPSGLRPLLRGHIAETPHGHIKHNMRIRQLSMRGKPKAAAEWTFTCTVHNLLKAITTGHLTSQALAALTS
jgi:Transposase DDE domain